MRRTRAFRAGLLVMSVSATVPTIACRAHGATTGGATFRLGIVEPAAIDPYNSQESEGQLVTKALFEGLVKLDDKKVELVPGVAEGWEHDSACSRWVFHLRRGTVFSSGEPVTATSFITGMTRAATREAASDTAALMSGIEGYAAVHDPAPGAAAAPRLTGLFAPDPATLVVNLSRPDCEFDLKTLQPVFSPVPATAGPAAPTSPYAQMPIGNGPFRMKEPWRHDEHITLVRNERYYGRAPSLERVDISILPAQNGEELEYQRFQAGEADYARIPPVLVPEAQRAYGPRHQFIAEPKFGVNYLLANVRNRPLDNVAARKAVSWAIDRQAVIDGVFKGFQDKATSLIPPALKAYYQPGVCESCVAPDAARARDLARQGGIPPGTAIDLSFNTGGGHEAWVQAIAQQLRNVLGLDVRIHSYPFNELLAAEEDPAASGLFRSAWGPDYPGADGFLRPLLSSRSLPPGGNNRGRYVNDRFDRLVDQAVSTPDPSEKVRLDQEAERVAIGEDLALIPLWYRTQYRVFSPRFSGVRMDFFENPVLSEIGTRSGSRR